MRKRLKPAAIWPLNGAAYAQTARCHIDSLILCSTYNRRHFSQSWRASQSLNYLGRCNTMSSSRTLFLRVFSQILKPRAGKRYITVIAPRRSDGFDDFDDFEPTASAISSMVRRRIDPVKEAEEKARQVKVRQERIVHLEEIVTKADIQYKELEGELERMLEAKTRYDEGQKRAYEEWMRLYEEVTAQTSRLARLDKQLFEEFFTLKYPEAVTINSYVDRMPVLIEQYKLELSNIYRALKRIRLASRRIDLEARLVHLAVSLNSLAERLSDGVVTPSASAKRNIDNIIKPVVDFLTHYANVQEATHKLEIGCFLIHNTIRDSTREVPKNKNHLLKLAKRLVTHQYEINKEIHLFRNLVRIARWTFPLGHAQTFTMAINFQRPLVKRIVARELGLKEKRQWSMSEKHHTSRFLAHWYLPRWTEGAPRSVDLSMTWRHLDVLYPFDLLYTMSRLLILKVEEIGLELSRNNQRSKVRGAGFGDWYRRALVNHTNLLKEVNILRYLTWLRLQTESKVYKLGGKPDTISKGLFKPRLPLSSDLRRFFLYVDAVEVNLLACSVINNRNKKLKDLRASDTVVRKPIPSTRRSATQKGTGPRPAKFQTKAERTFKAPIIISRNRLKVSTSTPSVIAQSRDKPLSIKYMSVEKKNGDKNSSIKFHRRRKIGMKLLAKTKGPKDIGRMSTAHKSGSTTIGVAKESRRGYSTISRALLEVNGHECGACERDIALTNKYPADSPQSVEPEIEDAMIGLVRDTQIPQVMSAHQLADDSNKLGDPEIDDCKPQFWSHNQQKGPDGGSIIVHYCKTLESAERVAKLFSGSEVVGFDIEWKAQALSTSGIKSNVSLVQLANEERIALFHLALFRPGNEVNELVPPSLREILESTNTVKLGVSIKADCSRVRRHLGIEIQGQLELSHLYKLVKYSQTQPKMVNRKAVNLSQQVEELLGLPLRKDSDVRRSDWTKPLDYTQVQCEFSFSFIESLNTYTARFLFLLAHTSVHRVFTDAASDAYACLCLYRALEAKRKALTPVPPSPAFAELNRPILLVNEDAKADQDKVVQIKRKKSPKSGKEEEIKVDIQYPKLD